MWLWNPLALGAHTCFVSFQRTYLSYFHVGCFVHEWVLAHLHVKTYTSAHTLDWGDYKGSIACLVTVCCSLGTPHLHTTETLQETADMYCSVTDQSTVLCILSNMISHAVFPGDSLIPLATLACYPTLKHQVLDSSYCCQVNRYTCICKTNLSFAVIFSENTRVYANENHMDTAQF